MNAARAVRLGQVRVNRDGQLAVVIGNGRHWVKAFNIEEGRVEYWTRASAWRCPLVEDVK